MNVGSEFKIDLDEKFPHLDRAPIVEAVIHWRARSGNELKREGLSDELKVRTGYPTVKTQKEVQLESQIGPQGATQAHRTQWHGLRFESEDQLSIAQFTRNGFVFSRLAPYEDWDRFSDEAKRLWRIHVEFARPMEIDRLGVRFINRVAPIEMDELGDVLVSPPRCPGSLNFPMREFLCQSRFNVPAHPYCVNLIQTTQRPSPPQLSETGLIIDIDVFTTATIDLKDELIDDRLNEMRWIKNKVFFATLANIDQFRESKT